MAACTIPPMGFHTIYGTAIFGQIEFGMGTIFKGTSGQWDLPIIKAMVINQVTKNFLEVDAVIDTGAEPCLVKESILQDLNIQPFATGGNYIHPTKGEVPSKKYIIGLGFSQDEKRAGFNNIQVSEMPEDNYPAQMIIGVSFLKQTKFIYNGVEKTFQIEF